MEEIEFTVKIYFSNGVSLERQVDLSKAVKLSMKENVIIENNSDLYEVRGIEGKSLIVPINMTFVVNASPDFKHTSKISRYMLYKRDGGRCSYCGKEITQKESTIDHVIPKSAGGLNVWENIALSCRACNCKKDNRTPEQAGMRLLVTPYNPKKQSKK